MELTDLLFIILSSVQAAAIVALIGLTWLYKQQATKIANACQFQAAASREHAEATTKLVDRLDAQNVTATHMAVMMSKGVNACLEIAKANQALATQTKDQADAIYQLADVSTKQAASNAQVASAIMEQFSNGKTPNQPESEPLQGGRRPTAPNGDIARIARA